MKTLEIFSNCNACDLSKFRRNIITGKGDTPADILFIIDCPSKTDDIKGEIFTGVYGKFLDRWIADSIALGQKERLPSDYKPSIYFTSLIGCRPCDRFGGETREPKSGEILPCLKRIDKIIQFIQPTVSVFMGKIVTQYLKKKLPEHFEVFHPQYLLSGGGNSHPDYLIATRKLSEAFIYHYNERIN